MEDKLRWVSINGTHVRLSQIDYFNVTFKDESYCLVLHLVSGAQLSFKCDYKQLGELKAGILSG